MDLNMPLGKKSILPSPTAPQADWSLTVGHCVNNCKVSKVFKGSKHHETTKRRE